MVIHLDVKRGDNYDTPPGGVLVAEPAARFFPLAGAVFVFFFARVTLIGGGVLVREASSSTSYAGKLDSGVAVAAPFPIEGLVRLSICAVEDPADPPAGEDDKEPTDPAPEGISPTRSMTKVCRENCAPLLRNMGTRDVSAVIICSVCRKGTRECRFSMLNTREARKQTKGTHTL